MDCKKGSVLKRMILKRVSLYIVTGEEKTGLAKCHVRLTRQTSLISACKLGIQVSHFN
jgi:hypothetical protein